MNKNTGIMFGINFGRRKFIPMENIASWLKYARGKRSAKDFAALIGCSMQTIYRYEWGERTPDMNFLQTVADKTGVPLDWSKEDKMDTVSTAEQHRRKKNPPPVERAVASTAPCQRCAELESRLEKAEAKLEVLEEERRELTSETRRLYREKEELLKELGELRATVARLEERKNRLAVANGVSPENSGAA